MIQEAVTQFQGIIWQAAIFGVCGTVFGGLVVFAFMYMFLERQKEVLAVVLVVGLTLAAGAGAFFIGRSTAPTIRVYPPLAAPIPPDPPPLPKPRPRVKKQAKVKPQPVSLCNQCQ